MKTKMLRKVQEFLLAEPRQFDMNNWIRSPRLVNVLEMPPCGTVCCVAGAAYVIDKNKPLDKVRNDLIKTLSTYRVETEAKRILGLTEAQATRLFYKSGWPARFRRAYEKAKTPAERVQAGVKRIDYFIKTRGK